MSNELIVIESANAVAVLSTDDGIKTLLDNVRANIDNMDGGSMKNKSSRAKIKSNAFKATKAFTKINDETIIPLIANLTAKIQPQLDVINAVKANQSVLKSGLQQIRKDVNSEVDEFEAELQRVDDEKAWIVMLDEADSMNVIFDKNRETQKQMDHMQAIIDNNEFDKRKSEAAEASRLLVEQQEAARAHREKEIAENAAEKARLKAEQQAKQEVERIELEKRRAIEAKEKAEREAKEQRQAAIKAELDAEQAREQAMIDADNAEKRRIAQEAESKRQADLAEKNRIAAEKAAKELADAQAKQAAEQAKQAEVSRQKAEQARTEKENAARLANQDHIRCICSAAKESLMIQSGLTERQAVSVVKAVRANRVANLTINF